jgi:hypothetical protein
MPSGSLRRRLNVVALVLTASILVAQTGKAEEAGTKSEGAEESIDSEHIFGFTEGTDIGRKGEREIESTFVGNLGKIGNYADLSNETALRYVVTDRLRLSAGMLADFFSIQGVPNIASRTALGVSGLDLEARYVVVDRDSAPFGMDVGINPQWRRLDEVTGARTQNYAMPLTLVVEKDFLSQNVFTAVNLTYTPALNRSDGAWSHQDSVETSAAFSFVVFPNVLAGGEIRYLALAENGTFKEQALFAGPSLYMKLAQELEAKLAWSAQVSSLSKSALDTESFNRHQIILLVSYLF